MKLLAFLAFIALAVAAVAVGNLPALAAWTAVILFGAAISDPGQSRLASNVAGFLTTADATTNDLVGEWMDEILVRQGKSANMGATLFGLMSRLPAEETDNTTYNWWERDPVMREFFSAAAENDNDTTFVFTDVPSGGHDGVTTGIVWQLIAAGQLFVNQSTGEAIRVTATPTTANVTVARGQLGTTAAAVATTDILLLVTLAKAEGAAPVQASYQQPESLSNYIQTFNESVSLTNAYKNNVLRTDKQGPLEQLTAESLEKICNDIELALFLGIKGSTGTTYYTGGIKNALDLAAVANATLLDNILDGNGTAGVTLGAFQSWMQTFMTNGSDSKLAFCGPNAYAALSNYANNASGGFRIMQPTESDRKASEMFGLNLTLIQTPYGEISLAMHPLFKNMQRSLGGHMIVCDMQLMKQKVMEPLFYEENIQLPGTDSYQGQFRAKLGLKLQFAGAFGYATDLQQINPN